MAPQALLGVKWSWVQIPPPRPFCKDFKVSIFCKAVCKKCISFYQNTYWKFSQEASLSDITLGDSGNFKSKEGSSHLKPFSDFGENGSSTR